MDKEKRKKQIQEAVARYDKVNTIQYRLKLNKKTDADIIAKLEEVPNKQGYIKALIKADICK